MQSISLIIPIFNEEKNIEILFKEIKNCQAFTKISKVIFVDDSSSDKSIQILEYLKDKENKITLLKNDKNLGQSYCIHSAVKFTNDQLIITMDGDCQNDPKDIIKLIDLYLKNYDVKLVSGIRVNRKDSLSKIFASKIANYIRRVILNDNCIDTGCSLKIFDKSVFLSLPYFDGMHRFLPALFNIYEKKVIFVPVNHRFRKYGKSKYGNFRRLIKGIKDLIKVKNIMKNK